MRKLLFVLAVVPLLFAWPASQANEKNAAAELAAGAMAKRRLSISRLADVDAAAGMFDPSIAEDPKGRLWMSYSTVVPSREFDTRFNAVSTRLARSDDGGSSWVDEGAVNVSREQPLPWPHNKLHARWEHEVSRIAYDPWSPPESRWKLLWHRYLRVYDGKGPDSVPLFEHGWIELKSAADPAGKWSEGRKLFVGAIYNNDNNNTIGKPEIRLDKLGRAMAKCPAFTEPGMVAREEGIYVALTCPTGKNNGEVVLLRCAHDFGSCEYRGALLRDDDARRLDIGASGFSGTDLVERDQNVYVVASPTRQPGDVYMGCVFYKVESLADARVAPKPVLEVSGAKGSFNGACGYAGARSKAGVFFGQYMPTQKHKFQVFETGMHPR